MKPNSTACFLSSLALVLLMAPMASAQADSPRYLAVDCMKSTSPDYVSVERDIWKPIHQELVNEGRKQAWVMWGVRFGSQAECDYYTVNVFQSMEAIGAGMPDLADIFAKVHPDADFQESMAKTMASRNVVWTQLWTMLDGAGVAGSRYAYFNQMYADNGDEYVELERTVFKPIHEALVRDGVTKGWGLYRLMLPAGSSVGYNYGTVDFVGDLAEIPFVKYAQEVHPEMSQEDMWDKTMSTRDMVRSELWQLIDRTEN